MCKKEKTVHLRVATRPVRMSGEMRRKKCFCLVYIMHFAEEMISNKGNYRIISSLL